MKYIKKNLIIFIKNEKMIFFLMLLCIFTSSFIIDFSYGLYQNFHVIKAEEESELYEFEIPFNNDLNGNYAAKEAVKSTLLTFSEKLNDSIDMYLVLPHLDEIPAEEYGNTFIRFTIKNSAIAPCKIFKNNLKKYGAFIEGEYFSDAQEANGDNVVLIFNGDISNKLMVKDDKISFQGKLYDVIGIQKMHPIIVPFNSLNEDTPINTILFHFKKPVTRSQYNEIKEIFSNNFGEIASIPDLDIPESENYYLYNTIILISVMIAVLAAVNFAVLYKYILSKRTKTLSIFRICGYTKRKALTLFLSECMFISVPVFVLTTLIYHKAVLPVLAKRFEYIESAYSLKLYLTIFAIYLLSSLTVTGIMIYFSFLRKTIIETKGGK